MHKGVTLAAPEQRRNCVPRIYLRNTACSDSVVTLTLALVLILLIFLQAAEDYTQAFFKFLIVERIRKQD